MVVVLELRKLEVDDEPVREDTPPATEGNRGTTHAGRSTSLVGILAVCGQGQ